MDAGASGNAEIEPTLMPRWSREVGLLLRISAIARIMAVSPLPELDPKYEYGRRRANRKEERLTEWRDFIES